MDTWLSYYHPSTVVFVDDQQAFLTAIKNRLPKQTSALFFSNAQEALTTITQKPSQYQKSQHIQIEEDFELAKLNSTEGLININLKPISEISSNSERFSEISVVIVDRLMPNLDGISFCKKLVNHPIKKIMLTASKDQSIATKAFNEGIIDFFLLKDAPDLMAQLNSAIQKLQKEYFAYLNNLTLGFGLEQIVPIIKDPHYFKFIQSLIKEHHVVEYYLLDRQGSMLFLQQDGSSLKLTISSEEMINHYANIAYEHEESMFGNVLSKKEKLLYFPSEVDSLRPVKEWGNFLFEAKQISQSSNLFYSLIN